MISISYVYADLIEESKKSGIIYKTIQEVPEVIRQEVIEILISRGFDL